MPAIAALHAADPRKELQKKVGDISDLKLFHNAIMVAVYIRPTTMKLKGGHSLIMPDKVQDEDRYQGKIGLVVAKGPIAFLDDDRTQFHGQDVEIGEWVVFRPSDGFQLTLVRPGQEAVLCRLLVEADIRARVTQPDTIW
jgi:hypothetical protein